MPISPLNSWTSEELALVERYLAGECTGTDADSARALLERSPGPKIAAAVMANDDLVVTDADVQSAWTRTAQRLVGRPSVGARARRDVGLQALRWMGGVAALVLVALTARDIVRRPLSIGAPTTYTTTRGQRALITLRDGSHVILGPQSTLSVASGFGTKSRSLALHGEARFEVNTSANAPFIVTTTGIATRVLGTVFNIRQYPGDRAVQVLVYSGKVVTTGSTSAATVTAGRGAYVTDSTILTTMIPELSQYTDLAGEQLVFKRTPVPELLTELGRWYGYEFQLADSSLSSERVSAMIKSSDATEMLKVLKAVLDVSMTFDGKIVRLTPNHDSAHERVTRPNAPARAQLRNPSMEIGR